jgi:broad specificity phosphatase PhoE
MFGRLHGLRPRGVAACREARRAIGRARTLCASPIDAAALARPRMEELVLVRHGESEGNVAFNRSVAGDHSLYSGAFLERHSSYWRLTDRGREQAATTGVWMRAHMDTAFDGHVSSEYLRAMETAALLGLPDAQWRPEVVLRERDWGEYDLASQRERRIAHQAYEARRRRESIFWAPPGGESLAQVVQRADAALLFMNRRFAGGRVVIVCHGELMWAFRLRFERLTQLQYREMQDDPQVPRPHRRARSGPHHAPRRWPRAPPPSPSPSAPPTPHPGGGAHPQLPGPRVHSPLPHHRSPLPRLPLHALRLPMGHVSTARLQPAPLLFAPAGRTAEPIEAASSLPRGRDARDSRFRQEPVVQLVAADPPLGWPLRRRAA